MLKCLGLEDPTGSFQKKKFKLQIFVIDIIFYNKDSSL